MILFIKKTFHKIGFAFIIAVGGGFIITFYTAYNWFFLGLQSIGIAIVYILSLWFLGFNSYEKELVIVPVRKILKKIKK
jgi:hypothetical protein